MVNAVRSAAIWCARLDPTSGEIVLAALAVAFGLALLIPIDLAARSPSFRFMVEVAPQGIWAALWLLFGVCQLFGATRGTGRVQADVVMGCLWSVWTSMQIWVMGWSIGPFVYGVMAIASVAASHLGRRRGLA